MQPTASTFTSLLNLSSAILGVVEAPTPLWAIQGPLLSHITSTARSHQEVRGEHWCVLQGEAFGPPCCRAVLSSWGDFGVWLP